MTKRKTREWKVMQTAEEIVNFVEQQSGGLGPEMLKKLTHWAANKILVIYLDGMKDGIEKARGIWMEK